LLGSCSLLSVRLWATCARVRHSFSEATASIELLQETDPILAGIVNEVRPPSDSGLASREPGT
jgi:hypothetical protein